MVVLAEQSVSMRSLSLLGVRLDDMDSDELRARLLDLLAQPKPSLVVTPNPEFLLAAQNNPTFSDVLNSSVLSIPDGVALRFAAAAMNGVHNLRRHPGVDVLPELAVMCRDSAMPLVLLGATDDILAKVKMRFATLAEGVQIVSVNPGIINEEDPRLSETIENHLQTLGPCVVAIALGQGSGRSQGKQEIIAARIVTCVPNARVVIGVGGAFNALSGSVRRAPGVFRRFGFEWLWRFLIEPWRFQRIFRATIVFPIVVAYGTVRSGTLRRALMNVAVELRNHFFL